METASTPNLSNSSKTERRIHQEFLILGLYTSHCCCFEIVIRVRPMCFLNLGQISALQKTKAAA